MENLFIRDEVGTSAARMDELRTLLNAHSPGGAEAVLTGHAHQLPMLSSYFNSKGDCLEVLRKRDTLRLSHSPNVSLDGRGSNLIGSICGSVNDPNLTSISCTPNFGEHAKLILDRMPPHGCHSFVGLCQIDTAYKRDSVETSAFNILCSQPNYPRGGHGHEHDGFSSFFGQHHSSRKFVGVYRTRPTGRLDDSVSKKYPIYVVIIVHVLCVLKLFNYHYHLTYQ